MAAIPDNCAVPRVSETVDDTTPITASRIDVAARIGWLLRTHRSVAGMSLRQMSAALKGQGVSLSAATLSRIESGGQRSPAALDGYARVLGMPEGALRAPVDSLSRTFPYSPSAAVPTGHKCLDRFSRSYEAIDVVAPTGGGWLEFAREHADAAGFGLPRTLMKPHVRRLSLELARSVGTARFTRHEALTLLRCSAYGDVVIDVLREIVVEPGGQNFWDLMVVGSERATMPFLLWAATLLSHPSIYVVRGASYALQSMLVGGELSLDEWSGLVVHVERAWRDAGDDPARRGVLSPLCSALPPPLQDRLRGTCFPEPAAPPGPQLWSRTRQNVHYVFAESIAREVAARRGHAEEPLLARLLFEAMFDPRGVRMGMATLTLAVSAFSSTLVHVLLEERDRCPDEVSNTAALRVAAFCHVDGDLPGMASLMATPDVTDFQHALTFASRGTRPLPQAAVDRGLSADEMTVRRTLYALGMTGDARLSIIATHSSWPRSTRLGARWWLEHGARILD